LKRLLLALADAALAARAAEQVFEPAGYGVSRVSDAAALRKALKGGKLPDLLFLGEVFPEINSYQWVEQIKKDMPALPVVLVADQVTTDRLLRALQTGAVDVVDLNEDASSTLKAAERALEHRHYYERWVKKETGRITGPLNRRLSEMEAILRQVNDGVMVLDSQSRVMMVNQALRQTFALGDGLFAGKSLTNIFDNPALIEAIQDQSSNSNRHEIQNKSGRVFQIRVSQVSDVGTVVSFHDISYLKELDRLKGDFVNTVSHDLRSPLTAILGYVELIERAGKVNPQQAEFIKRVKSSVHTTTNLIDDLLKLGKVEVGSLDEVAPVNMKLLVVTTLTNLQPQVQEKGQTLRLRRTAELPPVLGSRSQLAQVVDNLIGNAVKYTQPGGQIRVVLEEKQNQLIMHVVDNGPGIPLEDQGRIFEKFYRASNVEGTIPGTGLGLAIVKTIIDNHRGRIWVDSKPGEGSVFTVVLPLARTDKLP
jgi:signal transduction histidine kinase